MFDTKDFKKAIIKSQHCQRNWDLSKNISDEDMELLVYSVTNCPSKQNYRFYKAHFITNRDTIEQVHNLTKGAGTVDKEIVTNSQTLANLLVIFEDVERSEKYVDKWQERDGALDKIWKRDQDMAIGVAAGYLNVVSTMLGYSTGCCACFDPKEIQKELGYDKEVILMMGIGYPDQTRNRRIHHTENKLMPTRKKEEIEVLFDR